MSTQYLNTHFPAVGVTRTPLPNGGMVLSSDMALEPYPERVFDKLVEWVAKTPDQILFAKRPNPDADWQTLTYAQVLDKAHRIASALSKMGLSAERPIAVLSENDLEHALISLGASLAGVPYAPVSVAYSLLSTDFGKLRHILNLLTPGLVYASNGERFSRAISTVVPEDSQLVLKEGAVAGRTHLTWDDLVNTVPTESIEAMLSKTNADTIVKFLFTSGSTKAPKAVINTNRMCSSNQVMIAQALPFLREQPPVIVDWLPWSHTFGGNHNFYMALFNGGSFYIDEGKPLPALIGQTIRNLKSVSPTIYFNVPKGYDGLAQAMKTDDALRENFFKNLKVMFYAGASLAAATWDLLYEASERAIGKRVPIITSLGMTESAPATVLVNRIGIQPGEVGVPMPGVKIKLTPSGDKLEARYAGTNITPGYWRMPEESQAAFDADGWFITGDALKLVDENNLDKGLAFNGRTGEDFKLDSGTWVCTTTLRNKIALLAAPYMTDTVIAGHDRSEVTAILIPNIEMCKSLIDAPATASAQKVLRHEKMQAWVQNLANTLAQKATGGANFIKRLVVFEEVLSLDKGEMTDKGSINQRMVLKNYAPLVSALYGEAQVATPIIISQKS